jgi:hypothetical protein
MVNRWAGIAVLAGAGVFFGPDAAWALSRFSATMDNGTSITVDNDSSWSNSAVASLVLAADRSTQEDCPYSFARKGLFRTGDRMYASNYYLAWFDYTQSDGITFTNPPYGAPAGRSGNLAGWWSLDPASPNFRYFRTGPNGCWNWAHNELIPGSASPNHEQHWWDKYYTPNEYVICPVVGTNKFFFPYADAWRTSNSQFAVVLDGTKDAAGVHYKTSCRMSSWHGNIDVTDDNDANGIANYVQAELEYVCGPTDLIATWKFKPSSADVVAYNLFVFLWTAYAQDEDGTNCDAGGAGSQWPGTVYGQPLYVQSSHMLLANFTPGGPFAPGTIVQMVLGPTCSDPYRNQDLYAYPSFVVGDGSWIRVGESPTLSVNSPRWQYTNRGVSNAGAGTQTDPISLAWDTLESWNETHDGTFGFGAKRGPYSDPADYFTLLAGKWYQSQFSLSVVTQAAATIGLDPAVLERSVVGGHNHASGAFTVTNTSQAQLTYTITDPASWLNVSPAGGTCLAGEVDPIDVTFDAADLAVGDYTAAITVSDPEASNSPQTVAVTLHVLQPGDFDGDGDVDQADFGHLQSCLTGSSLPAGPACADADLNTDGEIKPDDVAIFLDCVGGASQPPGC